LTAPKHKKRKTTSPVIKALLFTSECAAAFITLWLLFYLIGTVFLAIPDSWFDKEISTIQSEAKP
jgi:energy-coupling factor transporter transmembrane protein EcfT